MGNKIVFKCPKFIVKRIEQRLPNSKTETRWIVVFNQGYAVVPFIDKNNILLIKEYKSFNKKFMLSLPSGGGKNNETPKNGALRELFEETGYVANKIHLICKDHMKGPMVERKYYVFIATDLKKNHKWKGPEQDEDIRNILIMPISKILSTNKNKMLKSDIDFIKLAKSEYDRKFKN